MLHSLSFALFFLSTACFFLAVQQPPSRARHVLAALHVCTNVAFLLTAQRCWGRGLATVAMPFFVLGLLHTATSLVVHQTVPWPTDPMRTAWQRIRAVYRIWNNPRGLYLGGEVHGSSCASRVARASCASRDSSCPRPASTKTVRFCWRGRVRYCLQKGATLGLVWAANRGISAATDRGYKLLHVTAFDFLPLLTARTLMGADEFCVWPWSISWSPQAFYVRAILATQWIWLSYALLIAAHSVLAMVFVGLAGWDAPEEWPPLFGDICEATSLKRFWGRFWHRLHTPCFAALAPPLPLFARHYKVLRALWIFLASAAFHAAVNWLVLGRANLAHELAFFLLNFVVCLGETVAASWTRVCLAKAVRALPSSLSSLSLPPTWSFVARSTLCLCGYSWVFLVMLCLAVPWQASLIRASLY